MPVLGRPPGGRSLPSSAASVQDPPSDSVGSTSWARTAFTHSLGPECPVPRRVWVCWTSAGCRPPESRSSCRLGRTLSSWQECTQPKAAESRGSWGSGARAGQRGALSGGGQPVLPSRAAMAHSSFQYNVVFVKQNEEDRLLLSWWEPYHFPDTHLG